MSEEEVAALEEDDASGGEKNDCVRMHLQAPAEEGNATLEEPDAASNSNRVSSSVWQ